MISLCVVIGSYTGPRYTISQIVGILYEIKFIEVFRSFILLYQWIRIHIWELITLLRLTPNRGALFVPMQRWYNFWSTTLKIIRLCLQPSRNSWFATTHKTKRQSWRSTLISSGTYLLRLNFCSTVWLRSKVTRPPRTIWYVSSRIESVEIKYHQHNSRFKALFMLMFYMCRYRYWSLLEYVIQIMMSESLAWRFYWHIIK